MQVLGRSLVVPGLGCRSVAPSLAATTRQRSDKARRKSGMLDLSAARPPHNQSSDLNKGKEIAPGARGLSAIRDHLQFHLQGWYGDHSWDDSHDLLKNTAGEQNTAVVPNQPRCCFYSRQEFPHNDVVTNMVVTLACLLTIAFELHCNV